MDRLKKYIAVFVFLLCVLFTLEAQQSNTAYLTFPTHSMRGMGYIQTSRYNPKSDTPVLLVSLAGVPNDSVFLLFLEDKELFKRKLNSQGFDTFIVASNIFYKLFSHDIFVGTPPARKLPSAFGDTTKIMARIKLTSGNPVSVSFYQSVNPKYSKTRLFYGQDEMYIYGGAGMGPKVMAHGSSDDSYWPTVNLSNGLASKIPIGLTYTASAPFAPYFSLLYGFPGNGFLVVTAQLDSTLLEFVPGCDLLGGFKKGQKYRKWLVKGQALWLGGTHGEISSMPNNSDISGTRVRVVNCKPVEILNGSYWGMREFIWKTRRGFAEKPYLEATTNYNYNGLSYRSIYAWQLPPDQALGRRYLIPVGLGPELYSRKYIATNPLGQEIEAGPYFNVVQAVALFDNTRLRINGRSLTLLKKGDSGGDTIRSCGYVESDKPVAVSYYIDPIRGCNGQGFPAFGLDNISKDTFRLNVGWNSGFINPVSKEIPGVTEYSRPYKNNAIAWVMALGQEGKGAVITVNGRKKTLTYRINRVPEPFYFDTVWLSENTTNRVQCSLGCYVLFASEFRKTGTQNVGVSGLDFEPKWLKMRAGGKWLDKVTGLQSFCAKTPILLEGLADWYKPEKVLWKIAGNQDTGLTVTHRFSDTGLQRIFLFVKRPYDSCFGTIWDTLIRDVRIYNIPELLIPADTTICRGSILTIKAIHTEAQLPVWSYNDTHICNGCDTIVKKVNKPATIIASISKIGCSVVADTIKIYIHDTLKLKITGPDSLLCYGKLVTLKAKFLGKPLLNGIYWNNGTYSDSIKVRVLQSASWIATAKDVCLNTMVYDTFILKAYKPLEILYPKDTIYCIGTPININPALSGGHPMAKKEMQSNGLPLPISWMKPKDTTLLIIAKDYCSEPDSLNININILPKPKILINGLPIKWCRNQLVNLELKSLGSDTSTTRWEISYKGKIQANLIGSNITWKFWPIDNSGLNIKSINKCYSIDTVIKPNIPLAPIVSWLNPNNICCVRDTIAGTLLSGLNATLIFWDKQGRIDSFESSSNVKRIISPARKTLWVTVYNQCSLIDTLTIDRSVADSLKLVLPNTLYCCYTDKLTIKPSASGGLPKHSWSLRDGDGTLHNDSTLSYFPKNNHACMVSISDGCQEKTALVNIKVVGTPAQKLRDTQACAPLKFMREVQLSNQCNWSFSILGGPKFSGFGKKAAVSELFKAPGLYQLNLKTALDTFTCPTQSLKINVLPKPVVSFISTPSVIDVATPQVTFADQSTNLTQRKWYQNGNFVTNEVNYITRFEDTGIYLIKLIGANMNGCNDSSTQIIRVLGLMKVYIPSAIGREQQNRIFKPLVFNGSLENMAIYSRWGQKLTEGESFNPDVYPGIEVFIYHITVRDNKGKRFFYSGTITTMR